MFCFFRGQRMHWISCSSVISVCLLSCVSLICSACHRSKPERVAGPLHRTEKYVGFSVFGPDWPQEKKFTDEVEHLQYIEEQGYLVAQHTSRLYGNIIRVPISIWGVLGRDLLAEVTPEFAAKPVYQLDEPILNSALDRLRSELAVSQVALEKGHSTDKELLLWRFWDAFFSGIQKYNGRESNLLHVVSITRCLSIFYLLSDRPH